MRSRREAREESGDGRLLGALRRRPVIPAVRSLGADFGEALRGDYAAVFVLGGDVFELVDRLREEPRRPPVCVNVELMSGISPDAEGISFLSRHVEGVISTHRRSIELASQAGLITVQRLFAIDSGAVERGLKIISRTAPGFVEILPALAYPEIAGRYREVCETPVLAGGLVNDRHNVSSLLASGARGVSTSNSELWSQEPSG